MLYLCRVKPLRHYLRGFLIAAWAGDKIAEFSFPEISFHFPLRPWFFFVSPAYAGKSKRRALPALSPGDHPRMCGEKMMKAGSNCAMLGSPPRMRGKECRSGMGAPGAGITPAYAGKRRLCARGLTRARDHPRVCGEKWDKLPREIKQKGSPPAYAGKRRSRCRQSSTRQDHPRVCGEKLLGQPLLLRGQGSPPRMLGKVRFLFLLCTSTRITPAYAGKSPAARHRSCR